MWPFFAQKWPFCRNSGKCALLCYILRSLHELRKKCAQSFDFLTKMPENGHFCSKSGRSAQTRKNARFSAIFCAHCANYARNPLSFGFGPKMSENGIFCSKNGQFLPQSGHFDQTRENARFYAIFCVHCSNFARNARKVSIFGQQCPKMSIFAPKVAIFRPTVAILRALRELRKKCVQSFDFWPKMPENGHFCSKSGHFSLKSGHFARIAQNSQEMRAKF